MVEWVKLLFEKGWHCERSCEQEGEAIPSKAAMAMNKVRDSLFHCSYKHSFTILRTGGRIITSFQQFTKCLQLIGHPSLRVVGKGRGWVEIMNLQAYHVNSNDPASGRVKQ